MKFPHEFFAFHSLDSHMPSPHILPTAFVALHVSFMFLMFQLFSKWKCSSPAGTAQLWLRPEGRLASVLAFLLSLLILEAMSSMARNCNCFVPGCKTSYNRKVKSENDVRYRLFAPSAKNLLLWNKAIPRADKELSRANRICELHFQPHHIIREDKFKIGNDTVVLPRIRPLLHPDV